MDKLNLKSKFDIFAGFAILGIVLMIIIPLPPFALDILLSVNIALSVLILLLTLFSTNILQLSMFPTILLVTTLFRLGLNISSTRLILGQGYAGSVIESFGSFVVGGNYVVGVIIFLIIMIVQFVVITNGSGRVSEVSARFTLDAMPGKQMSIDADLGAGIIDEKTARKKRSELQQEVDFYGAMDGASKFVKGDAIAGIIVTIINVILHFEEAGKFIIEKEKASIGMLQRMFKIGFNRAARIMDQLCDAGVVGPEEGTKPRKVLMSMEEFQNYLENQ